MLTFAIGDVHGRLDKLDTVLRAVESCADGRPHRRVFLGDYIDRGPESRAVVERVMALVAGGDVALCGNHEDLMVKAVLGGRAEADDWLDCGAGATLRSYGLEPPHGIRDLPLDHVAWMRALPLFHDDGVRFFVHAGVDPERPLHEQTAFDMLWVRDEVPPAPRLPRYIVHGHTPREDGVPHVNEGGINLDTGCGYGEAPLSAAMFEEGMRMPTALIVDGDVMEFYPSVRP